MPNGRKWYLVPSAIRRTWWLFGLKSAGADSGGLPRVGLEPDSGVGDLSIL